MNMLLTYILYCDAGPSCLIRTVRKHSMLLLITDITFALIPFSFGDAVALLRESYTFVYRLSYVSCIYLIELLSLELDVLVYLPFDSNVAVYAKVC